MGERPASDEEIRVSRKKAIYPHVRMHVRIDVSKYLEMQPQ